MRALATLLLGLLATLPQSRLPAPSTTPAPIAIRVGDFIFDGLAAGPLDGDPVILLHGFPETSYAFRHQIEALAAAGYRAVAPDQRGYSPDARPPAVTDYGMSHLVADVVGIADALGFESFHLVGHDWGGAVAWVVAARFPDRVRSLTALSTPHPAAFAAALADPRDDQTARSSYFNTLRATGAEGRLLDNDAAILRQLLDGVGGEAADRYVGVLGDPEAMGAALNWYRASGIAPGPGGRSGAAGRRTEGSGGGTAGGDVGRGPAPALAGLEVSVPTLYVWGAEDPYLGRGAAEATAAYVSGPYRFVPLARTGHWLMERDAGEINALLLDHLADSESPYHLAFTQIRRGIWLARRRNPYRQPVFGNVTIIVNDDDVVVVDSGSSPAAARQIIAKIRSLTSAPVSVLVNTHGHEDHVLGNQVFAEEFPGIEIVAREGTRDDMADGPLAERVRDFARGIAASRRAGDEEIARLERRGLAGDGEVVRYLRRYYDRDIEVAAQQYAGVRVTPPTSVLEGRRVLERGGRTIELLDLGSGKAGSDIVVYLPRERLVIAGDVVTHPIPLGFARLQTEWLETLRRVAELDFDDLVPGHGEALVDKDYVEQIIALAAFEIAEVRRAVGEGRDLESTSWRINFRRWAEAFAGDDPIGRYRFETWFVQPAIERAYAELRGF